MPRWSVLLGSEHKLEYAHGKLLRRRDYGKFSSYGAWGPGMPVIHHDFLEYMAANPDLPKKQHEPCEDAVSAASRHTQLLAQDECGWVCDPFISPASSGGLWVRKAQAAGTS